MRGIDDPAATRRLLAMAACTMLWLGSACTASTGASGPGTSSPDGDAGDAAEDPAVRELAEMVSRALAASAVLLDEGYAIRHMKADRLGENGFYTWTLPIASPYSYVFLGVGGGGITDLDLRLYTETDVLLAGDTLNNNEPVIYYSPNWQSEPVTLEAHAFGYDRNPTGSSKSLFLWMAGSTGQAGRAPLPMSDEEELADVMAGLVASVSLMASNDIEVMHVEVARVPIDDELHLEFSLPPNRDYFLVGSGGPGIEDLDIVVWDPDGAVVGSDVEDDNVPIVEFNSGSAGGNFTIGARAYSLSDGFPDDREFLFHWVLGS